MDIPLEALTTFSYDGKVIVRGQEFLARSTGDAKVLTLLRKAKFALHAPLESLDTADEKPKRKYKRRDLTAEAE